MNAQACSLLAAVGLSALTLTACAPSDQPRNAFTGETYIAESATPTAPSIDRAVPGIPGTGTYQVDTLAALDGDTIRPDTYSSGGHNCHWERLQNLIGYGTVIDSGGGPGRVVVTIRETDKAFRSANCAPWIRK